MSLVVVAALLGLTGKGGPLASATVRTHAGSIEYPRISRWQSNDHLTVTLPPEASGEVEVRLSNAFVELFAVQAITPEPSRAAAVAGGHRFTFDVDRAGGPKVLQFQISASNPRLEQKVAIAIGGSAPAELTITVLP